MLAQCAETISILQAILFGAGDACVRIDMWSILSALAVFFAGVVAAQFAARRLWARIARRQDEFSDVHTQEVDQPITDDPNYRNSAIRSSKR